MNFDRLRLKSRESVQMGHTIDSDGRNLNSEEPAQIELGNVVVNGVWYLQSGTSGACIATVFDVPFSPVPCRKESRGVLFERDEDTECRRTKFLQRGGD